MHAERFGKALGFGMRQAGRTLARAAEAAAAPAAVPAAEKQAVRPTGTTASSQPARTGGVRQGARQFTSSVIGPAKRAGSVLWLEVTGFFFGVFALIAGFGVWAGRAHLRPGPGRAHELAGVVMLVVFAWFAVSNFVRASRRSRRP